MGDLKVIRLRDEHELATLALAAHRCAARQHNRDITARLLSLLLLYGCTPISWSTQFGPKESPQREAADTVTLAAAATPLSI